MVSYTFPTFQCQGLVSVSLGRMMEVFPASIVDTCRWAVRWCRRLATRKTHQRGISIIWIILVDLFYILQQKNNMCLRNVDNLDDLFNWQVAFIYFHIYACIAEFRPYRPSMTSTKCHMPVASFMFVYIVILKNINRLQYIDT